MHVGGRSIQYQQSLPLYRVWLLTILVKDLSTSLEPDWLLEADTVLSQKLRGQASQGTEHSPPGVDDLDLPADSN